MILSKRSFFLILLSVTAIYFGAMINYAYLPRYLLFLNTPDPLIQLTRSVFTSTFFIFPSIIGKLSDKIQNRYLFIVFGIMGNVICLLLLLFTNNLVLIIILLFIFGFFSSAFSILFTLYVEVVQNDPKKISLYNACFAAGWFLGVQTGGILINAFGIEYLFLYSLIPFIISFLSVIFIKEDRQLILEGTKQLNTSSQQSKYDDDFQDNNSGIKSIIYGLFFRSFGFRPILGVVVIIMGFHLTNEIEIGFLIGINPLLQFFLMILVGKVITNKNLKTITVWGYIMSIVVFIGYILSIDFWSFLSTQILLSLSYSLLWTGSVTYIAQISTPKNKGRYMGYVNTSAFAGDSLGGLFLSLLLLVFYNDYYLSMYFMIIFPIISLIIISLRFKPYHKTMQDSKKSLDS